MKKAMILSAIAAMFMFFSCQKDEIVPGQDSQSDELVFTATIVDQATKTTINTDASSAAKGKVSWEVNDEISVSDGTNIAVYYIKKASDIAGDGSAVFTYKSGTMPSASAESYTAIYGDAITATQMYSATAGKLPMTGASDSDNKTKLNFTVTCGLLKLNLTANASETDKTISKVEVVGRLAGAAENTIFTLTCSSEESIESAKDFYIALPAGSYTDMVFYNKSGYVCQKTNNSGMAISSNKIQPVTLNGIAFNLLPGKFSVSDTKQVRFSKGNLYYSTTDSKYHIESEQNVTYATLGQTAYDETHVCHFFWSNTTDWQTSGKQPWQSNYSYSVQSKTDAFFCGIDDPITVDGQSGLFALTGGFDSEWDYLFNERTNVSESFRCGVSVTTSVGKVTKCVVIAPDGYAGVIAKSYTADEWAVAESYGFVCLPSSGYRIGEDLFPEHSYFWSATPYKNTNTDAYFLSCNSDLNPAYGGSRRYGCAVRLVSSVSK